MAVIYSSFEHWHQHEGNVRLSAETSAEVEVMSVNTQRPAVKRAEIASGGTAVSHSWHKNTALNRCDGSPSFISQDPVIKKAPR